MKILQTIKGLNIEAGGLTTATYDLVTALNQNECPCDLLSGGELMSTQGIIRYDDFVKVRMFDNRTPLAFSAPMRHFLEEENEYDLYHTNGLWVYINHITCKIARKKQKPYVISAHGMLYPEAMKRSSWKKKLLLAVWFQKDLAKAACIHCTCHEEMKHCRDLGLRNPIAVIANPVPIPDYINEIVTYPNYETKRFSGNKIGFIGRFHQRKNIDRLLFAWEQLKDRPKDSELVLIGTGEEEYIGYLKKIIEEKQLKNVVFTGQLNGKEKFEKLAELRAIFVPSGFENFGMIVPEALMVGTPVMASTGTPWQDLEDYGCGWWRDNSVETLTEIMKECFAEEYPKKCVEMGISGRKLVEDKYSSATIVRKMVKLYEYLINPKNIKPDYLYYD